ncbi:MFS transporter [Candidatus Micrarchaeota archaeon]|nr:MFS transporter [Candidatus Micrarchaeota archaeon]
MANKWLNKTVWGASITSFLSDMSHEAVTALLPAFLAVLGAPAYALGLIEGVSDGLSSFIKLFSGYYADKLAKRKEIATIGYGLTAIYPVVTALAGSWPVVLVAKTFGWLGRGARGPAKNAILAQSVPKNDLGKAFGFNRAWDTAGAIAGPLMAFALLGLFGVRDIFLLATIPALLAAPTFWFFVEEKKTARKEGEKQLRFSLEGFSERYKRFVGAVSIFGAADFSHTLLIMFAVATLTPSMGAVNAAATGVLLYALRNVVYALAAYPFGALGDKFGRKNVLVFGYALAVLTFIGFIVTPPDVLAYAVLFSMAGAFIAAEDALESAVAGDLVEERRRALGYGILATANGVGDFISSAAVGFLWTVFGFGAGFAYSAALGFAGTLALALSNTGRLEK